MGELLRGVETPRIPETNNSQTAEHRESHATGEYVEVNEDDIAVTRGFILDKYHIPAENVTIYEYKDRRKPQRKIRAFALLTNTLDPEKNFYAEGHASHAALNNMMGADFGNQIGITDIHQLFDEDTYLPKKPWVYRKGFLDPFHNGFKNFPALREDLLETVKENQSINDFDDKDVTSMENGDVDLPNWFLSADTSREQATQ